MQKIRVWQYYRPGPEICTIFKIANNGGAEWRENGSLAYNLT